MHYETIKKLLFLFDPEKSHHFSLEGMKLAHKFGLSGFYRKAHIPSVPVEAMGLQFKNPVGLAAGLDKNGDYIDALGDLGFGFIEVGTVTPRAQPGNPKPRLFRLPEHQAIINRMGFNNKGVDHLVTQVQRRKYQGVLGINIGKNFDTAVEEASRDYLIGLEKVYPYADYIAVNLSSPNTPGLRTLQTGDALKGLVNSLADKKSALSSRHGKNVPLLIKIAPDMAAEEITYLAKVAVECEINGLIATNTTIARDAIHGAKYAEEAGGLSGQPVFNSSTCVLAQLAEELQGQLTLVGVGGINSVATAKQKLSAGASLIQLYTGFIYQGPELIENICRELQ